MENPKPRKQPQAQPPSFSEVIYAQYKDLREQLVRVEKDIDRTNTRMDRLESKLDKLDQKLDDLHRDMKSSSRHGQAAEISTIGIALAVIYFIVTHTH